MPSFSMPAAAWVYHTLGLAGRGFRCVGVDIAEGILETARENAVRMGLDHRVAFRCQPLEKLEFADETFDAVHCRGVLMHIPRWQVALGELCRVLKPGGKIVVIEANAAAVEARLVCLARHFFRPKSKLVRAAGGLEFWSNGDQLPFVVRMADTDKMVRTMQAFGVGCMKRLATEFWDIYHFPAGPCRNLVILFNRLWFALHLPAGPSIGNAFIGEKACREAVDNRELASRHALAPPQKVLAAAATS